MTPSAAPAPTTASPYATASLSPALLREAYQRGTLTPSTVAELVLARAAAADAQGHTGIWIDPPDAERLLSEARGLEARGPTARALPLYGVPFAVKDNIDVAGRPTTAACPAFAYTADRDAFVVARLRAAGALFVGKTNLDQFATGLVGVRSPYGVPTNPFDGRFIVGGSSSGSAAAVARGLVSFALGTDTAGSGRVPAAFTNLVGLKPSPGLLSTRGVVPACRSLDCVSVFAPDVATARMVGQVAAAFDAADPFSRRAADTVSLSVPDAVRFQFGVPRAADLDFLGDDEARRLFAEAVARLMDAGGHAREVSLAPFFAVAQLLYDGPWIAERWAAVGAFAEAHPDALLPITRQIIEKGSRLSAADAFRGRYELAALAREVESAWAHVDALLVPTTPTIFSLADVAASPLETNTQLGRYTNFVNLLDMAGVAVPAGFRKDGLPLGVTLLGPWGSDARLLDLAARAQAPMEPATVRLAVVGAHLSGFPLNYQLTDLGAVRVAVTRTAPLYRLFALPGTTPPKPGLVRAPSADAGAAIDVEVWQMPRAQLGSFFRNVLPPLSIGTLVLEDGSAVLGFLCEAYASTGARDITTYGGWRRFLAAAQ